MAADKLHLAYRKAVVLFLRKGVKLPTTNAAVGGPRELRTSVHFLFVQAGVTSFDELGDADLATLDAATFGLSSCSCYVFPGPFITFNERPRFCILKNAAYMSE